MATPKFLPVDKDRFRNRIDRAAHFRRRTPQGALVPTAAPMDVVADMMADWPFPVPELLGVASAPFFTPSG